MLIKSEKNISLHLLRSTFLLLILLTSLFFGALVGFASTLPAPDTAAVEPWPIEASSTIFDLGASGADRECFETFVEQEGWLRIDLVPIDPNAETPVLSFPARGAGSERGGFSHLDRGLGGSLIEIRQPGFRTFCATAPAGDGRLGAYALQTRFVSRSLLAESARERQLPIFGSTTKDGENEEEGEVDVDPLWIGPIPSDTSSDLVPSVRRIGADSPAVWRAREDTAFGHLLGRLCRSETGDDHGDGFGCATPVHSGRLVIGRLAGQRAPDVDVFAFRSDGFRNVRVRVESEAGQQLAVETGLHDRFGRRLAWDGRVDGEEEGRAGRSYSAVLGPGWYFVRLLAITDSNGGSDFGDGVFRLRIEASGL